MKCEPPEYEVCWDLGCCYRGRHYRIAIWWRCPCGIIHPVEEGGMEGRSKIENEGDLDVVIRRLMEQTSIGKRESVVLPSAPEKRMLTERGLSKRQLKRRSRGG